MNKKVIENTILPESSVSPVKTRRYRTIQERDVAHILDAFYRYRRSFSPRVYRDMLVGYIEKGEMVKFWEQLKKLCETNIKMEKKDNEMS